jgi:peptidoglycan-N-acetylglucosamine deacetylase
MAEIHNKELAAAASTSGNRPMKSKKSHASTAVSSASSSSSSKLRERRDDVFVPEYQRAAAGTTKSIWLTFDDGPHSKHTETVLKTLERYKIRATFFVLGENAKRQVRLVRTAFQAGHRIGNHSFSHRDMSRLSESEIRNEFKRTEDVIGAYLGREKLFRPPYGAHNASVDRVAVELGYRTILWNVDTLDWNPRYQPDRWVQHGIDQIRVRDSCRVLAHDIHRSTAENVELLVQRIRALGKVTFKPPSTL